MVLLTHYYLTALHSNRSLYSATTIHRTDTMKFCVINTENSKIWNPVTFHDMFQDCLGKDDDTWHVCNIADHEPLPDDIMSYNGIVITGSHHNVRDRDTLVWFDSLCNFIRDAAEAGSPNIYGGCFGCQIIAHALGGKVDYNPEKQFALKAETIKVLQPTIPKPCCSCCGAECSCCLTVGACDENCLNMIVSHAECVVALPPHTDLIGTSDSCEHEIFVTGPKKNIICCQSHPEFTDVQYCIHDRIAPVVIDKRQRLTPEQAEHAMETFAAFTGEDARRFMQMVSEFLRR